MARWSVFGAVVALCVSTPLRAQVLVLEDALAGSTTGTASGGAFADGGWKVTSTSDALYWHLSRSLPRGAVEFSVKGLRSREDRAGIADKVDLFHMYDWTVGNADTSYGGYRDNPYKHFIRKTGALDTRPGKTDSLEMVWVIAPNYMEPDTAVLSWDPGVTYLFREEWGPDGAGNTVIKTWRNGELVMTMSEPGAWAPAGHAVKIGMARLDVDHGAPLDAVFSGVRVWDLDGTPGGGGLTPAAPDAPPAGMVRVTANSLVDDNGAFLGLGTTYMTALHQAKHDRALLRSDLRFLKAQGFNYVRILGQVGGDYWLGLEIAPLEQRNSGGIVPAWTDWTQQLQELLDIVFEEGLRTQITIFGSAGDMTGGAAARTQVVEMVLAAIVGREDKVILIEVANEGWQNGFPGADGLAEMRALTSRVAGATDVPVAITSNHGANTLGETYAGSNADIATWHFSRDLGVDDGWGPVHDSWFADAVAGVPPASSNEPVGPGASVASETRPIRLVMAAAFSWVAKLPMHVFHTSAGVRHQVTFESMAGATDFRFLRRLLPGDVASWVRNDGKESAAPFTMFSGGQANRTWPETGANDGCVRNIGARKEGVFVALPIGIRPGGLTLQAREPLTFKVYHPLTGEVVSDVSLAAGEQLQLPEGPGAYIVTNAVVGGPASATQGLHAHVFGNADFTAFVGTRVDAQVRFDFGNGAPLGGMDGDTFSIRWAGELEAPTAGAYVLHTVSDDGVRLWVDGTRVVDDWNTHGSQENHAPVTLAAGRHAVAMEYFDQSGGASVRLEWEGPGIARQVVPSANLFPVVRNQAAFVSQEVPASMAPGGTARVRLTWRNTGTSTWTAAGNHRLGAQAPQDTTQWGDGRTLLPADTAVRPGLEVTFAFDITAPSTPGAYVFQRRMLQENLEWFGDTSPAVTIAVGVPVADAGTTVDSGTSPTADAGTTPPVDGGSTGGTTDGGATAPPQDAGPTATDGPASRCACAAAPGGMLSAWVLLGLLPTARALRRRHRRI